MDNQVVLSDGRRLGYRVTGPSDGKPLFYFHGFPGSRMEADLLCERAGCGGWRIFSIDRPGMGLSEFARGRTLLDWPGDIAQLADSLGIDQFSIVGVSGGGPYAAVCAWAMPDRVRAAAIVCGLGPVNDPESISGMHLFNRLNLKLMCRFPALIRPAYRPVAFLLAHWPMAMIDSHIRSLPLRDRAILREQRVRRTLASSFRESVRQGPAGGEQELRIYSSPWPFDLSEIRIPICLWHGDLDTIVPCAMGRHVAATIPQCRAVFSPEDGHYSLLIHQRDQVLSTLFQLSTVAPA